MSDFEKASLSFLGCSCKSPSDIPEQFALKNLFREGSTVNSHKGPLITTASVMDTLGKYFFAGSCFALDEYCGIGLSKVPGK